MPAAGSLSQVGQHGIDWIHNHQHPQVWIGAARGQTNHLASTAGHHAETQHYRPAGARTGLAAPRRPSLVVQEICRIAGAVDDDDLAGTMVGQVARMSAATCRHRRKHPDVGSLTGPRLIVDYLRPAEFRSPLLRTCKTCDELESHAAGTVALLTKDHFCRTRPYGLEIDSSLVAL